MVFQFCSKKTVALLLLALSARDKFRLFLIGIIQKRVQIVQSQGEISDMSIYNLKFNGFLRMNKFINWIMRYKFVDIFRIQNKYLNMSLVKVRNDPRGGLNCGLNCAGYTFRRLLIYTAGRGLPGSGLTGKRRALNQPVLS